MFPRYQDDRLVAEFSAYTDSMIIAAKVLDTDLQRDLAMIQVQELPKGVKELRITAGAVDVGETVHSVGNPGASGTLWIYTSGTVRSVYRTKLTRRSRRASSKRTRRSTRVIAVGPWSMSC